jgi:NitT/TauT family transport system ATP-binding protein
MMIAGLYAPTSGQILIDDVAVEGPFSDLGIVFQKDVLLDWRTVLNNVLLPMEVKRRMQAKAKETYRRRALELLSLVGLEDFANAYPEELSGGMRQRVAICRALIHDPPLLLMDEPFGALDALTRERLNLDFMHLTEASAKTVVFVTHNIEEAVLLSDQVVVLTPRPGNVLRSLRVELPRPRTLATRAEPTFHHLVNEIRDLFHSTGVI